MPDEKILNGLPTGAREDLERFLPEGRNLGDLPTELVDELHGVQFTPKETISERFEVIEQLGFGGMGAVYKVKDSLMRGQLKALKVMLPSLVRSQEARERFISEAQIAQSLRHEGIATVYDIGKHKDFLFLTMELLEGTSLDRYLKSRGGRVDFPEAVDMVLKICDALAYAHKKGVIHRDIKPQNIFVLPDGRVKLLDFGLAKLFSPGRMTRSSIGLGTAYYMSPEQSTGKEVDERSDIFSLGVVFYQMLIGRIPMGRFKLPSTLNPSIPSSIDSVVEKCLDEQPDERYLKVESLVVDIEQVRSAYEKEEKEKIEKEQKALAERKRKIDSLLKKGKSALDRNNFDEAISTFNEILGIDQEQKEVRGFLDRAAKEKARFEKLQKEEEKRKREEELRIQEEEGLKLQPEEAEKRTWEEEKKREEVGRREQEEDRKKKDEKRTRELVNGKKTKLKKPSFVKRTIYFLVTLIIVIGSIYVWNPFGGSEKEGLIVRDLNRYDEQIGEVSLFVIEGKVNNQSRFTKKHIKIRVAIFDQNKVKLEEKEAICGPMIGREELKNLPEAFFKGEMVIRPKMDKEMITPPGKAIPFMVIFKNLSTHAKEFQVEIIEAPNL
jgi:serine/threonine protein kinase